MKTALITTTIHVPRILELLRRYDSDVRFFIAGDEKSPEDEMEEWLNHKENISWLPVRMQKGLGYKCSEVIGWNCIQRRNIALLEALKWGAEIIITWDDDNLPMNSNYFFHFSRLFECPFNGLQIGGAGYWTDIGAFAYPHDGGSPVVQRGTPQNIFVDENISFVTNSKIGLAQGIILGSPDTSAIDRISRHYPEVHQVSELLRNGVVLHPQGRAAVNSQNTAFLRRFAPTMFMAPGLKRGDDIVAGLLTQRIMRDWGYQVHFGFPFAYQQRNPHDLLTDLQDEMWLMENTPAICDFLDKMDVVDVLGACRHFFAKCSVLPQQAREAGLAFLEDVAEVTK